MSNTSPSKTFQVMLIYKNITSEPFLGNTVMIELIMKNVESSSYLVFRSINQGTSTVISFQSAYCQRESLVTKVCANVHLGCISSHTQNLQIKNS